MKDIAKNELLNKDLSELDFPESFLADSATMKFKTLGEILEHGVTALMNRKGYTNRWFSQLTDFLLENDMVKLLKDI